LIEDTKKRKKNSPDVHHHKAGKKRERSIKINIDAAEKLGRSEERCSINEKRKRKAFRDGKRRKWFTLAGGGGKEVCLPLESDNQGGGRGSLHAKGKKGDTTLRPGKKTFRKRERGGRGEACLLSTKRGEKKGGKENTPPWPIRREKGNQKRETMSPLRGKKRVPGLAHPKKTK